MQAAASTNRAEAPLFQSCSAWELGHGSGHGCRNRQGWVSSEFAGSGKETRLSLQPFADNPSALLTVAGPRLGKDVVGNFIALDAERA
jgi:hypothetical protein